MNEAGEAIVAAASKIREIAAEVFSTDSGSKITLVPGIGNALDILLPKLGCNSLLLTDEEYYDEQNSPLRSVMICNPQDVISCWKASKPDAILMSLVSWRGKALPVEKVFSEIAAAKDPTPPLLIADYSHAGAIGFPGVHAVPADLVCGDLVKWIVPPERERNLAFLWCNSDRTEEQVERIFTKYYLATSDARLERSNRWIEPTALLEVLEAYSEQNTSRQNLILRYEANKTLASRVARNLGIGDPQSCILWSPHMIDELKDERLRFWHTNGGTRIICRADI